MKKAIIYIISILLYFTISTPIIGQEEKRPVTKLEEILLLKSSLIIKEIYPLGKKQLPFGVTFDWVIVKTAGTDEISLSGLRVEIVNYSETISNKDIAVLDLEEVKDLIPSIIYMENLINQYRNEPPKTYTEVEFSTKGNFKIGFYCKGKDIKAFMSAGSIRPTNSFFGPDKLVEIRTILEEALKSY